MLGLVFVAFYPRRTRVGQQQVRALLCCCPVCICKASFPNKSRRCVVSFVCCNGGTAVLKGEHLADLSPCNALRVSRTISGPSLAFIQQSMYSIYDTTHSQMGVDILISGHTHQNSTSEYEGKWFINPGSITGAYSPLSRYVHHNAHDIAWLAC
jgi:hypothetical protein